MSSTPLPLLLLLPHANRISCIRQRTTIYAITTAIYRPPIHANDTVRGTDGILLSVLLHPSLQSSFARRAIRYGLQITRIVVAADL